MRSFCLLSSGLLALLAGCAVGPDYQKPPVPTPAAYGEAGPWGVAVPKDNLPKAGWWAVFADPELDRLETQAGSGSLTAQAALDRFDEAAAIARVSRASLFPAVAGNFEPYRDHFSGNRAVSPGAAHPAYTTNSIDAELDLSYQLDVFGRIRRGYESARDLAQAQWADYENVLLSLQAEVAQDYFSLRSLRAQRDLLVRTVDLRSQALDLVRKRRVGGASDDLDVYQAEAELASIQSDLLAVDRSSARLRHALAILVGSLPEDFSLDPAPLVSDPPAVPAGLPSELLERRPDVAAAERTLASANALIGFAKAAFFPTIGLTAGGGFNSTAFDSLLHTSSSEWSLGPFLSVPLFQGGANRANYERAKAAYDEQVARYRQQVLTAFGDVDDGLSDLRYLAAQAEALGRAATAAQKAADLSTIRYKQGVADYFEVIDAQRTALDNELLATELQGQRFVSSVLLVKALGGGWSSH
jgi:multidrug efflux system outer membrane protein